MGAAAFITDRTEPSERAHMLGYNAVAYGVGMLFGPVLGGWLGKTDLHTSAWIATAGAHPYPTPRPCRKARARLPGSAR